MNNVIVQSSAAYSIHVESDFGGLADSFRQASLAGRRVCIVTDRNVLPLYADAVIEAIRPVAKSVVRFDFEAGEQSKNIDVLTAAFRFFAEAALDRHTVVLALGGGVVGDLAGFAAACYMRGLPFVQVPTTLLAQVDSSVGGKTGIDFRGGKNLIGAFYQPRFVYINVSTLHTLPPVQVASGMAEVIKHGLIADSLYLDFIRENADKLKILDVTAMKRLVTDSCRIKADVVSQDEKETGRRAILNFGHTFGHAVESLLNFTSPHGFCVAFGCAAALYLSQKMGKITAQAREDALALLGCFGLAGLSVPFSDDQICAQMRLDKKGRDGQINLILLEKIGNAFIYEGAAANEIEWAISQAKLW